jgi:hypothetical protein
MKREKIDLKDDLVITKENVQTIGEKIAICAVQNAKRFAYGSLDKLYKDLVYDINHKIQSNEIFTDGYDIAQEAICYLCNFLGHKLGEVCVKNIHGKYDCIRLACYKYLYCYLRKQKKSILDELSFELYQKTVEQKAIKQVAPDYSKIFQMIKSTNLTNEESQILLYLANGTTAKDTIEFVNICERTYYKRKESIRQKLVNFYQ